jgi:hypothetical protein
MNGDPFDNLLTKILGPDADPRAWLLNPFHPAALFCVLASVMAMIVMTLLTQRLG